MCVTVWNRSNKGEKVTSDQVNDQVNILQLTDNQRDVLRVITAVDQVSDQVADQVKDTVTTSYIAAKLNLSYSTVKRALRVLKELGLVVRCGSDKTGYWSANHKSRT